jgi:hypothetical protein
MIPVGLFGYLLSVACVLVARQFRKSGNRIGFSIAAIVAIIIAVPSTALIVFAILLLSGHLP